MIQKGDHTWNSVLYYHRCPQCGFVFEDRQEYQYTLGKYTKQLQCERCAHAFTVQRSIEPKVGPVFGEGSPVEMEWN